jgi:hypothetical protein
MADHWSVTVERNGEQIVAIESNCLSGRDISPADEEAIRIAARHLLAFIGVSHVAPDRHPPNCHCRLCRWRYGFISAQ